MNYAYVNICVLAKLQLLVGVRAGVLWKNVRVHISSLHATALRVQHPRTYSEILPVGGRQCAKKFLFYLQRSRYGKLLDIFDVSSVIFHILNSEPNANAIFLFNWHIFLEYSKLDRSTKMYFWELLEHKLSRLLFLLPNFLYFSF